MTKTLMTTAAVMALLAPGLSHAQSSGSIQATTPTASPERVTPVTLASGSRAKFTLTGDQDWCAKGRVRLTLGEGTTLLTRDAYVETANKWANHPSQSLAQKCPDAKSMVMSVESAAAGKIDEIEGTKQGDKWDFSGVIDLDAAVSAAPPAPPAAQAQAAPALAAVAAPPPTPAAASGEKRGMAVELFLDTYPSNQSQPESDPASSVSLGKTTVSGNGIIKVSMKPAMDNLIPGTSLGDRWSYSVKYTGQIKTPMFGKYVFFSDYVAASVYLDANPCWAMLEVNGKPILGVGPNKLAANGIVELDEGLHEVRMTQRCFKIQSNYTVARLAENATFKVKFPTDPTPRALRLNDFVPPSAE